MVVEGDRAVVGEPARAGLADVVHEGGEAGHEVRAAPRQPVLQGDRLVDFLHTSKMEVIEGALQRLNVKLKVEQQLAQDPFDIWINLPESRISAGLTVRSLVDAFGENRELVVGKSNAKLGEVKEHSVDYILRQFAHQGSRDTRQATIPVIDAIVASGAFRRSRMIDPVTRREVDSIAIL